MSLGDWVTPRMTITMYGADWCGDCRRAKAWFEANDIAYMYVDLVDDPDETERVLERNNGVKRIPVIVFPDDSHLTEPTNDELAAKMAELASGESGESSDSVEAVDEEAAESPAVIENSHLGRFELLRNGDVVSFADYRVDADDPTNIIVPHVETDPRHRGNGYADQLMIGMLGVLRNTNRTITPRCSFAREFISANPDTHDLVT